MRGTGRIIASNRRVWAGCALCAVCALCVAPAIAQSAPAEETRASTQRSTGSSLLFATPELVAIQSERPHVEGFEHVRRDVALGALTPGQAHTARYFPELAGPVQPSPDIRVTERERFISRPGGFTHIYSRTTRTPGHHYHRR